MFARSVVASPCFGGMRTSSLLSPSTSSKGAVSQLLFNCLRSVSSSSAAKKGISSTTTTTTTSSTINKHRHGRKETIRSVSSSSSSSEKGPRVIPAQTGPFFKKSPFSVIRNAATIDTLITDFNGTLFDASELHQQWASVMSEKLSEHCGEKCVDHLFKVVKFDPATGKADGEGMMAMRPWNDIYDTVAYELSRATGMKYADAALIVASWRGCVDHFVGHRPLADLQALFSQWKENGVEKFAITTAEDRAVVLKLLEENNVLDYVDIIVAGTDPIAPKPQIDNIRYIMRSLESLPESTLLIGDTKADMLLGRNGDIALRVGVLSGRGTVEQLQLYTDVFIETAEEVSGLLRGEINHNLIHVPHTFNSTTKSPFNPTK
eukprot:m.134260 g.134260  ORF g.134260 m.134260 type:complete len:377 (-) comp13112_c7_seq7:142-1272(-)